jgi:Putative MetA-pathway of phenol degradation
MATWAGASARPLVAALPFYLALAPAVLAHGDHGGGGGTVLPAGVTVVTAEFDYSNYRPISDARLSSLSEQGVGEVHSLRWIAVPSVSIGYGLTSDLTLGLRLPYLANREIRETDPDNGGVNARGSVYGFGDVTATATWRFLKEQNAGVDAAVILGFKAPTGRSDALDKSGVLFETEHQPGSGSWDGVFGLTLAKQVGPWGLSANGVYGLAGDGDQDTNLGDRFSYGIGVAYRVFSGGSAGGGSHMHLGGPRPDGMPDGIMYHGGHAHAPAAAPAATGIGAVALDLTLGLNGEWHAKQEVAGVRDENTGGHVVYVSPGFRFSAGQTATTVTFGIPVATNLNGTQSDPDWRLTTSFGVQF